MPSRPLPAWLRSYPFWIGVMLVEALVFRLALLRSIAERNPDGGDPLFYHLQANFVVDGKGFSDPFTWLETGEYIPVAIHPPAFTLWLAIPSWFGLDGFTAHKVMSVLAGVLAVAAIGMLARELAGDRAGAIATAIAAVYPPLWSIDGQLWPEGLFTAFVALACWSAVKWWWTPGARWALATGAFIGLATLTRGEAVFLTFLLALPVAVFRPSAMWSSRLRDLGCAALAFSVLVLPWTVRNLVTFEETVLVSTNSEEVLVYANNPYAYGQTDDRRFLGFWFYPWQDELRARYGEPPGDASEKAAFWGEQGRAYARDNLDRVPVVVAARLGRAWNVYAPFQNATFDQIDGKNRSVSVAGVWAWWAVLALSIPGVIVLRRRGQTLWPMAAMAAMVSITAVYAYGANRFRTPLDMAAVVLASVTIAAFVERFRPSEPSAP